MWRSIRVTPRRQVSIVIGVAALFISGCRRPAPGTDTTGTTGMRDAVAPLSQRTLIGPTWTLVELEGRPAPSGAGDRPATLMLEGGATPRASGFAGCNRWSSEYSHTPPDRIRFTAPSSTKMACATGMDLEQRYLQMITATRSYTVSDSGLALRGDAGVHARFVAR